MMDVNAWPRPGPASEAGRAAGLPGSGWGGRGGGGQLQWGGPHLLLTPLLLTGGRAQGAGHWLVRLSLHIAAV